MTSITETPALRGFFCCVNWIVLDKRIVRFCLYAGHIHSLEVSLFLSGFAVAYLAVGLYQQHYFYVMKIVT